MTHAPHRQLGTTLFKVLADPPYRHLGASCHYALPGWVRRHVEMDASGMLRAIEDATIIDHVDPVFSMALHHPSLGDYITDNRVVEFEPDRRLTWATGRRGQPPAGVRWGGSSRRSTTHTPGSSTPTPGRESPILRCSRGSAFRGCHPINCRRVSIG